MGRSWRARRPFAALRWRSARSFDAAIARPYCRDANAVSGIPRESGNDLSRRRGGRVAEGGGLLNRCRVSSPTVSSNLIPSANSNVAAVTGTDIEVMIAVCRTPAHGCFTFIGLESKTGAAAHPIPRLSSLAAGGMPGEGFEPPTFGLQNRYTTTVLTRQKQGW